jgi:hypothetical protein
MRRCLAIAPTQSFDGAGAGWRGTGFAAVADRPRQAAQ